MLNYIKEKGLLLIGLEPPRFRQEHQAILVKLNEEIEDSANLSDQKKIARARASVEGTGWKPPSSHYENPHGRTIARQMSVMPKSQSERIVIACAN